ncbi:MAG: Fic family protein [archaeon]
MVYIYEKKINGESYYYLRLDKRINGKKIVKDIAYLGNNLNKINIEDILNSKNYGKEIKKSYRAINRFLTSKHYLEKIKKMKLKEDKYLTKEQLQNLEIIKLHFKDRFLKLDSKTKKQVYDDFLVSFTYNTTSIEGNTISLNNVRKFLSQENFSIKNKNLREIYDLRNTKDTFYKFLSQKEINKQLIIDIHDNLMKDIDNRTGFRKHDVRVFKSRFDSSPYFRVEKEINELLEFYKENKNKLHPFVLATIFHHKFEKIHPFYDGNGRSGRMIFNLILINSNFAPIIITKTNRNKYLDALETSDKLEDYSKLISFLITEYEKGYFENFLI